MTRWTLGFCCLALLAGCPTSQKDAKGKILAYIVSEGGAECARHADATSCNANGCAYVTPEIACLAGMTCPGSVCVAKDPCIEHQDAAQCAADARCAWSATRDLVAVGSDPAAGGFCHAVTVGGGSCACVSPVSCPTGSACPPMECDCAGGGESGGSCTCACAACEPGGACPPCACDCRASDPTENCVTGGTCACACPACPDDGACAPCACDCVAGDVVGSGTKSSGGGTGSSGVSNCTCPACVAGSECAPCTCDGGEVPVDPCNAHADATACVADTGNACAWYGLGACACPACEPGKECPPCECDTRSGACVHVEQDPCAQHADAAACAADAACTWYGLGVPCAAGEACRSGVCQTRPPSTDPGGCVCACPAVACDKDSNCMSCACTCDDGGASSGGACTPPSAGGGSTEPSPPPSP